MRSRGYFWALLSLSAALLFPSFAAAETIRITSGFVEMGTPANPFNLVGDRRGFRLFGSHYNGGTGPNNFVFCPDLCGPGAVAEISHAASGLDFGARATLDGILYEDVGSLGNPASAAIGFTGSLTLPSLAATTVLHTPFTMEGSFATGFEIEQLIGSGIVTSTWMSQGTPSGHPVWVLNSLRYDFAAAPIPEPTTLVLVGVAGAAAALGRRRRRAR